MAEGVSGCDADGWINVRGEPGSLLYFFVTVYDLLALSPSHSIRLVFGGGSSVQN